MGADIGEFVISAEFSNPGIETVRVAKGVKPGINRNEVYDLHIPIPPLHEQQRIAAILDEAFDSITTAKANAEQNQRNARELFDSYLHSVFAQRGEGWIAKKLGELGTITSSKRIWPIVK